MNEGAKKHIFDITRRWLAPDRDKLTELGSPANADSKGIDGIDGWRLDVPNCIVQNFWTGWRRVVKSVNPNAYTVGEIWELAKSWLTGEQFDAVMNYEFNKAICRFFYPGGKTAAITASEFARQIIALLDNYSFEVNFTLQNLLSSHDIDRISSAIYNRSGWKQGRIQDDNPHYNSNCPDDTSFAILKLIAAFQMTWPGAPMIYYGDEIGMFGADDPSNRMPMWWQDLMPYNNPSYKIRYDLRDNFKYLIALRNTYPQLRTGAVKMLFADNTNGILAYKRTDGKKNIIIVLNNSGAAHTGNYTFDGCAGEYYDLSVPGNIIFKKSEILGLGSLRNTVIYNSDNNQIYDFSKSVELQLQPFGWRIFAEK